MTIVPHRSKLKTSEMLNAVALAGWAILLLVYLVYFMSPLPTAWWWLTLACELICASEVAQIVLGILRGRVILGVALHGTRLIILTAVMPLPDIAPSLTTSLVLLAWATTEVSRYPMFLSDALTVRKLRYAVPVLTFPVGAGGEAWLAWLALDQISNPLLYVAVWLIIPSNVIGGATYAYPGIIKKAAGEVSGKYKRLEGEPRDAPPPRSRGTRC